MSAVGGKAEDQGTDGCRNGAAGTVYMVKNDTLVIDNNNTMTTRPTIGRVPQNVEEGEVPILAQILYVQKAGRLMLEGEHHNVGFHELYVFDKSYLKLG